MGGSCEGRRVVRGGIVRGGEGRTGVRKQYKISSFAWLYGGHTGSDLGPTRSCTGPNQCRQCMPGVVRDKGSQEGAQTETARGERSCTGRNCTGGELYGEELYGEAREGPESENSIK